MTAPFSLPVVNHRVPTPAPPPVGTAFRAPDMAAAPPQPRAAMPALASRTALTAMRLWGLARSLEEEAAAHRGRASSPTGYGLAGSPASGAAGRADAVAVLDSVAAVLAGAAGGDGRLVMRRAAGRVPQSLLQALESGGPAHRLSVAWRWGLRQVARIEHREHLAAALLELMGGGAE